MENIIWLLFVGCLFMGFRNYGGSRRWWTVSATMCLIVATVMNMVR